MSKYTTVGELRAMLEEYDDDTRITLEGYWPNRIKVDTALIVYNRGQDDDTEYYGRTVVIK